MSVLKRDCPKCERKIDLGSNFCINCGFSVKNNLTDNKKVSIENRFGTNLISEHLQNPSERNVQIIAILEVLMGSILFFGGLVISSISYFFKSKYYSDLFANLNDPFSIFLAQNQNFELLSVILMFFLIIYGSFCLISGLGLFYMKNWGKVGTIVNSGIGMIFFPIGTLIGGLLIYYLTRKEIRKLVN